MYFTFSQHNRTFQSMGIWTPSTANVTGVAEPEEVRTEMISDGVLRHWRFLLRPAVGFLAADQDPHGAKTVMLSYGYWQRRFGGDRSVIGRTIQVDAQTREIVGVMPRGFRLVDRDFDLLIPLALDRTNQKLAGFGYNGIARLKPGIPLAQADADIARLIPVWMDSWSNGPGTNPHYYERWRITPSFRSLKQQVIGSVDSVLWVVMATVGLVMLIACTNVANLLLVRAESRQQELSIRAALGAGRMRIARELLIESVSLGLLGGVIAIGVAFAGLRLLVAIGPADLPRLSEISLDARSLGFTLAALGSSGIVVRIHPGLEIRPDTSLRNDGRHKPDGQRRPRAAALAQCAGHSPGSHGARSPGQRSAYDSHLRCPAQRRARLCRSPTPADHAHLDSGLAGLRSANGHARSEQHRRQTCCDSGSHFRWVRRRRAHGEHRSQLGRDSRRREKLRRRGAAAQALQLRFARIFQRHGHASGCRTRLHMDGHLRPAA